MVNYFRKALVGATLIFVMNALANLLAFTTKIILARNLSITEYGLFYAVFNLVMFLLFFRDLGLGQALVKYIAEYRVNKKYQDIATSIKSVITFQVLSSLFFAAIFWIFADKLASSYFQIDSAALILRFLIVYVIFSILFRFHFF